jgi:hypothetical protein
LGWKGAPCGRTPSLPSPQSGGLTAPWVATTPFWSSTTWRSACSTVSASARCPCCSSWYWYWPSLRDLLVDALRGKGCEAFNASCFTPRVGCGAPAPGSALWLGACISQFEHRLALVVRHGAAQQAAHTTTSTTRKLIASLGLPQALTRECFGLLRCPRTSSRVAPARRSRLPSPAGWVWAERAPSQDPPPGRGSGS